MLPIRNSPLGMRTISTPDLVMISVGPVVVALAELAVDADADLALVVTNDNEDRPRHRLAALMGF